MSGPESNKINLSMLDWLRVYFLFIVKIVARVFYRFEVSYINDDPEPFRGVRLGILLNHTSLMEPVYLGAFPNPFLKKLACRAIYPGAKETLDRPIVGRIFKLFAPRVISLTRKRDNSWDEFIGHIDSESVILFLPEGRMKRPSGLDKNNMPMTMRSGIVDLLTMLEDGKLLICYSGGLHHIQVPGGGFPKLFKTVHCAFESIDIAEYLKQFTRVGATDKEFRTSVLQDLEKRRDQICPRLKS